MTSDARRREILALIHELGRLSTREIAERFGVTMMTAHRDLALLERRGLVQRYFGGAAPVDGGAVSHLRPGLGSSAAGLSVEGSATPGAAPAPVVVAPADLRTGETCCTVCLRPILPHLGYLLVLADGAERATCCPHCGVSAHLVLRDQVASAFAADTLTGCVHPAAESHFVLGSEAAPCCRPSILTFEDEANARRFRAGFGGQLGQLAEALEFLREAMRVAGARPSCPHCAGRPG